MPVLGLRAAYVPLPHDRRPPDRRPPSKAAERPEPIARAEPLPAGLAADLATTLAAPARFTADLTRLRPPAEAALAALLAAVRAGDLDAARAAAEALDPAPSAEAPRLAEAAYDTLSHYFDAEPRPV